MASRRHRTSTTTSDHQADEQTSTSSGNVWFMFFNVTVTLLTGPTTPATLIVDGYGAAGPEVVAGAPAGIKIGAGFENVCVAFTVAPSTNVLVTVPRLSGPSFRFQVAVSVPPQTPEAVKLKSRVADEPGPLGVRAP